MSALRVASWNVRTLLRQGQMEGVKESIVRKRLDVILLQETRMQGEERVELDGSLYYIWQPATAKGKGGLAIITTHVASAHIRKIVRDCDMIGVLFEFDEERWFVVNVHAPTDVQPRSSVEEQKEREDAAEKFYQRLDRLVETNTRISDHLLLGGDWNITPTLGARTMHPEVFGKFGLVRKQEVSFNTDLLAEFALRKKMALVGSVLPCRSRENGPSWHFHRTWTSPKGTSSMKDGFLVLITDICHAVQKCRVDNRSSLPTHSDHHLVTVWIKLNCKSTSVSKTAKALRREMQMRRKEAAAIRKDPDGYNDRVRMKLQDNQPDAQLQTQIESFQSSLREAARAIIPQHIKNARRPWLSEATWKLVRQKSSAYRRWADLKKWAKKRSSTVTKRPKSKNKLSVQQSREIYVRLRKQVVAAVKHDKERYWADWADELDRKFKENQMYEAYTQIRHTLHCRRNASVPIEMERWKEYYGHLYARVGEQVENIPLPDEDLLLDNQAERMRRSQAELPLPLMHEAIDKAVGGMRYRKAPGKSGVTCEHIKGSQEARKMAKELISRVIWRNEWPWDEATLIPIHKGGEHVPSNYRPICLNETLDKAAARVLKDLVWEQVGPEIAEYQMGFCPGRSTVDHIWQLRQVQRAMREKGAGWFAVFLDFTKAFDSVRRDRLAEVIVQKREIAACVRKTILALLKDTKVCVQQLHGHSGLLSLERGVRQGCTISPLLFVLVIDEIVREFRNQWRAQHPRAEWGVWMLRQDHTGDILHDVKFFADDGVLLATSRQSAEEMLQMFAGIALHYGLEISTKKTEWMHFYGRHDCRFCGEDVYKDDRNAFQCLSGQKGCKTWCHEDCLATAKVIAPSDPSELEAWDFTCPFCQKSPEAHSLETLCLGEVILRRVEQFRYLGSIFTTVCSEQADALTRLSKGRAAWFKLRELFRRAKRLSQHVKLRLFNAMIPPILLYASESWISKAADVRLLESFYNRCLRYILRINQAEMHMRNTDLWRLANTVSLHAQMRQRRLRWFGHMMRKPLGASSRQVLFHEAPGQRPPGRPPVRWHERIAADLKELQETSLLRESGTLHLDKLEIALADRSSWNHRTRARETE